jgi:hypothetical protein
MSSTRNRRIPLNQFQSSSSSSSLKLLNNKESHHNNHFDCSNGFYSFQLKLSLSLSSFPSSLAVIDSMHCMRKESERCLRRAIKENKNKISICKCSRCFPYFIARHLRHGASLRICIPMRAEEDGKKEKILKQQQRCEDDVELIPLWPIIAIKVQ